MKVAVVIPVYKENPSVSEIKSFKQAILHFSNYDVYLVGPSNLNLSAYRELYSDFIWSEFDKKYFINIEGYSQLMLSSFFYFHFIKFEYILIYQLDCYVFDNQLDYWCNKKYDYVGAPWIEKPEVTKKNTIINISSLFVNNVGNGGFSLRKVTSFYNNTRFYRPLLKYFVKNEDIFWGLMINFLNPFFKKPKASEALRFGFELNPKLSYELNNNNLPFGVHAWEKYDLNFWNTHIK